MDLAEAGLLVGDFPGLPAAVCGERARDPFDGDTDNDRGLSTSDGRDFGGEEARAAFDMLAVFLCPTIAVRVRPRTKSVGLSSGLRSRLIGVSGLSILVLEVSRDGALETKGLPTIGAAALTSFSISSAPSKARFRPAMK